MTTNFCPCMPLWHCVWIGETVRVSSHALYLYGIGDRHMMMAAEPVNLCEEAAETLSRVLQSLMAYLDKKLVHIEPPLTRDEAVGRGEPLYTLEEIIGYRCHPSLEKNVMTSSHVLNCSEPLCA